MKKNIFIENDLINKVQKLRVALDKANSIIITLEKENENLKNILDIKEVKSSKYVMI